MSKIQGNIHTTDINNMANPYLKYLGKEDILQHSVMEYMKNKYPNNEIILDIA